MIEPYLEHHPSVDPGAWVHAHAVVIGDVSLARGVTVWPGTVLRGDQGSITVGVETSLQDGCVVHATKGLSVTSVGARCVVGHRAVLHGCVVGDDCLIGMGAVLLDNCQIGDFCIIGAGAVVPVGRVIPPRSMVLGVPGRIVRTVTDDEIEQSIRHGHGEYVRLGAEYRERDRQAKETHDVGSE